VKAGGEASRAAAGDDVSSGAVASASPPPRDVGQDTARRDPDPPEGAAVRATPPSPAPIPAPQVPAVGVKTPAPADLGLRENPTRSGAGEGVQAQGAATLALSNLLLDAWIAAAPAELERFIQAGPGARLPDGQRQLVASFWQACMGDVERAAGQIERLAVDASVTAEQVAFLQAALAVPGSRSFASQSAPRDPLARSMRVVLALDEGRAATEGRDAAHAAVSYSDAIHLELSAPWAPRHDALVAWGEALSNAQRQHRLSKLGSWPGVEYVVQPGDNLINIRKRMVAGDRRLLLCTGLMAAVNGVKDGRIDRGDVLRFPTDTPNVLVDLDARVVVFRLGSEAVRLWPVGIGREGHDTPVGTYDVGEKLERPSHMPRGGPSLPYGHPDNPLGTRWIAWNKDGDSTTFGFHGTSNPDGIGGRVSQGCIRMRNEDVEELYELLPRDARVIVQP